MRAFACVCKVGVESRKQKDYPDKSHGVNLHVLSHRSGLGIRGAYFLHDPRALLALGRVANLLRVFKAV